MRHAGLPGFILYRRGKREPEITILHVRTVWKLERRQIGRPSDSYKPYRVLLL